MARMPSHHLSNRSLEFAQTLVRVPFRIFTPEEEKLVSKNYKSIKKQVEEAGPPVPEQAVESAKRDVDEVKKARARA